MWLLLRPQLQRRRKELESASLLALDLPSCTEPTSSRLEAPVAVAVAEAVGTAIVALSRAAVAAVRNVRIVEMCYVVQLRVPPPFSSSASSVGSW